MAEPVYKKITELDLLSTALDGNETLPIVKSGKTYRRLWANFFGSGWITSLLAAFSAFKAPDADHADDADTVGGEDKATLHTANNLTGVVPLGVIPAELTGKNAATATKLANARTIGGVAFDGSANINLPGVNTAGNQNTSGKAATAGAADTAAVAGSCSGNAATATLAATATNALACSGNAATATTAAAAEYANNAKVYNYSIDSSSASGNLIYSVLSGIIPNVNDSIIIAGVIINPDTSINVISHAKRLSSSSIRLYGARVDYPALYTLDAAYGGGGSYTVSLSW